MEKPIARVLDLVDPASHHLLDMSLDEARRRVLGADPAAVLGIRGSFALVAREGERVCLARSLDRPLRYFLAKDEGRADARRRRAHRRDPRPARGRGRTATSSTLPIPAWCRRTT